MEPEVVVVTGAGAGLGRAIVRRFAGPGVSVGLISRNAERLRAAAQEVEELGGRALALPTDVADAEQVERAAAAVEAQLGPIDVWVNNAMTSVFSPAREMKAEEYRRVTEVTYLGYVYGTLSCLRRMLPRDRGTIVQVGSALAYRGIPLQSAYCGAKHAIQGFTESVRAELYHDRSRVWLSMVQMPAMNTPQFDWVRSRLPNRPQPVPPIFQPEVAAEAVYYAAHHRRRQIYVGMPTLKAIYCNKFVPGLLDRYLARNGYDSQQTQEPERPGRPDNLWQPVPGSYAAHGRFDARSHHASPEVWATLHRSWVAVAAAGMSALALAAYARTR